MEKQFIESVVKTSVYKRKENTATSYYRTSGERILPERLSISRESQMNQTANKGRNLQNKVIGQLLGTFKKSEFSPLKQNKPYNIRTNIWEDSNYPQLIGYGTIGISNEAGKIDRQSDTGDLIVLYSSDRNWDEIEIYFYTGAVMEKDSIMTYLSQRAQVA